MVGWPSHVHHQLDGLEFEQTREIRMTGKPDMLQSMGMQKAGHSLATEQQKELGNKLIKIKYERRMTIMKKQR